MDVSAIKGDVFPDENARMAYLDHSLQSVLQLVGNVSDAEYVDVALIVLRLVTNFQVCDIRTHILAPSRAYARTHTPTYTHSRKCALIFEGNDWGSVWCLLLLWRCYGVPCVLSHKVRHELLACMPRTVGL